MEKNYHDVHDNKAGVFNTRNGLLVDLHNPTVDMIIVEDIAHALSNICRFGGHTAGHYSVLEHSYLVAALAPLQYRAEALMHDAVETYLGDVIKPLKNILGRVYTDLEHTFEELIIEKFNLNRDSLDAIKQYDIEALELEHRAYILDEPSAINSLRGAIRFQSGGYVSKVNLRCLFSDYFNNQR